MNRVFRGARRDQYTVKAVASTIIRRHGRSGRIKKSCIRVTPAQAVRIHQRCFLVLYAHRNSAAGLTINVRGRAVRVFFLSLLNNDQLVHVNVDHGGYGRGARSTGLRLRERLNLLEKLIPRVLIFSFTSFHV